MSIRKEQCNKVCRILDDVLANRPTERDSLIIAVRKAFESPEQLGNSEQLPSAQPEIIRCKDCIYYDPPHIENNGERYEYKDMPKEAFDIFGICVTCEYGINVGGRCERDYNAAYDEDKRVFVPESNFCGRARRRTNGSD